MICLIASCEPARMNYLPQFITHYRNQGVEQFLLSLQFEPGTPGDLIEQSRRRADRLAEQMQLPRFRELHRKFDAMTLREHHDAIQAECGPADWLVWADIDEFHVFPGDLRLLTRSWARRGCNAAGGVFVDRVARDGSLPAFDPSRPIWSQYPLGCDLTRSVVMGMSKKVVIARKSVRLRHANHNPVRNQRIKWARRDIAIFHFKWDESVIPRLQFRISEDWKQRCPWWTQSNAALLAIESGGGRLPLHLTRTVDYLDDKHPQTDTPYRSNPMYRRSYFGHYEP